MPPELHFPSAEAVMRVLESVFTPAMTVLLVLCAVCLWLMRGSFSPDRQMDKEIRLATAGGWLYLALALAGYGLPRVYFLLVY